MKNIFQPFLGTSDISFGMTRSDIRKALGNECTTFLRNEFADNTSDYYEKWGLFIEYNQNDTCNAIEITSQGNLFWKGENLLELGFSRLREKFDPQSRNFEEEEEIGVTYFDLGFGVTHTYNSNDLDSIIIFEKGYWED